MHKNFMIPISVEEFAAYLDGNLSERNVNRIDNMGATNHDMQEMLSMSDKVDEDMQYYLQDGFAYEADMVALENCNFDIPNLDTNNGLLLVNEDTEYIEDAFDTNLASESIDKGNSSVLNDSHGIVEDMLEKSERQTTKNEDSMGIFNDEFDSNQECSDLPLNDFFE